MSGLVLLVDDSHEERRLMKASLEGIFNGFIEATDGLTAIKSFVEEKPRFIITDVEMPSLDGYKFISTIRNMSDGADIPVIMISGTGDTAKKKLRSFHIGASDFLIKPYDPEELVARVRSLLKVRSLMDELKEKNILLERLATIDDLTGIYNRRCFFDKIRDQIALGLRHNFKIACLLIDIDEFKRVNDTAGHLVGDEVLKTIGRALNSCKREGEMIARFGGEEFIMCLFNTDPESAHKAAERFRALIEACDFAPHLPPGTKITASIGVALFPQDAALSIDELIKAADKALYRSKREGRNRVSVFDWSS